MTKKGLIAGALIVSPCLLFFVLLFNRPLDQFTFRGWEALKVKSSQIFDRGPFYINQKIDRPELGDMGSYKPYSTEVPVIWQTDPYGYRNSPDICANPEILVLGDSNGVGCSLTQSATLSEQLAAQMHKCVWNLSGPDAERVLAFIQVKDLHPKVIIWTRIERYLRHLDDFDEDSFARELRKQKVLDGLPEVGRKTADWLTRVNDFLKFNPFQAYKSRFGFSAALERLFVDRNQVSLTTDPDGTPPLAESSWPAITFHTGPSFQDDFAENLPARSAHAIRSAVDKFAEHSIKTIFVPIPEKETVYPELVPMDHPPDFYFAFLRELTAQKVTTIDLLTPFRQKYDSEKEFLFQRYDTHWNEKGVQKALELVQPLAEQALQ